MARTSVLERALRRLIGHPIRAYESIVSKRYAAFIFLTSVVASVAYQNCTNSNFAASAASNSAGITGGQAFTANNITLGATINVNLPITEASILAANTAPSGQSLTFVSIGALSGNGTLTQSGTTFNFISKVLGASSFSYTITDTNGDVATATVTVQTLSAGAATGYFYASNLSGDLYVLDPSAGTLVQLLASTYKGASIGFNDMAIDSTGTLYGKDVKNNIYSVNVSTGVASLVISNFVNLSNQALGLTFLPNGNFATVIENSSDQFSVISVNPKTLAQSTIVPYSAGYSMHIGSNVVGDIKALPDGYLYWTVSDASSKLCKTYSGAGNQTIVRIDPNSGATTELACATLPNIVGLGMAQKDLYAFSGPGDLIQINLSTDAFTLINATGDSFVGATSNPALW